MKLGRTQKTLILVAVAGLLIGSVFANRVWAHCDTLNGPIIPEARAALEKRDATAILKWVRAENEAEVQKAFTKAVAVRNTNPEAREVADQYFLETLIRLHRLGEGASFTGLKDEPVEPIVALAEKALAAGAADGMLQDLNAHMGRAIREKFDQVQAAAKTKDQSVEAGRAYVEAYVTYMHFVEGIHKAILADPGHHQAAMQTRPDKAGDGHGH
jgi:hypothetical protein